MLLFIYLGVRPYDEKEDEREALAREIGLWTTEGLQGKKFHGGDTHPDVADLDVYGVLQVRVRACVLLHVSNTSFQSIRGHTIYKSLCAKNPRLMMWLADMDRQTHRQKAILNQS